MDRAFFVRLPKRWFNQAIRLPAPPWATGRGMKFGVPRKVTGVRPDARDTAREAARRAGMSVGEWLNTVILDSADEEGVELTRPAYDDQEDGSDQLFAVHERLDELTRQLERLHRAPAPRAPSVPAARGPEAYTRRRPIRTVTIGFRTTHPQLADARPPRSRQQRSRRRPLMRRPRRFTSLRPAPAAPPRARRYLDAGFRSGHGGNHRPDDAGARRRSGRARGAAAPRRPPSAQRRCRPRRRHKPRHSADRISPGWNGICATSPSQIEALRQQPQLQEGIAALRQTLSEIARTLLDAMPKQAIEALESEVRALASRLDNSRHSGVDNDTLATIERGLADVLDTLRSLRPAENLDSFRQTVHSLAQKIDMLGASAPNPKAFQQLEAAVSTMRGYVSQVASNEALAAAGRRGACASAEGRSGGRRRPRRGGP